MGVVMYGRTPKTWWPPMTAKRYLALDTSMSKSGWAVLEREDGLFNVQNGISVVDYGLIRSNAKLSDGERLRQIHAGIVDVLRRYPDVQNVIPREAGIIQYATATKQIFKSHGVCEFALADYTIIDVNIMTVKAWSRRLTGADGKRNEKALVAEAVRTYFDDPAIGLDAKGRDIDDVTDAIAVGIVYLTSFSSAATKTPKTPKRKRTTKKEDVI